MESSEYEKESAFKSLLHMTVLWGSIVLVGGVAYNVSDIFQEKFDAVLEGHCPSVEICIEWAKHNVVAVVETNNEIY